MNHLCKTKLLLFLLLVFSWGVDAMAQEKTISGKVVEQQNGRPISGVTVKVKNNTAAALTDENGGFQIKVPSAESVITFSYVGYGIVELKAGAGANLSVSLVQVNNSMDEVVVVGYGTKKRANVLGSVATIKSEDIEDLPVANLGAALINRLPGVGVNFASGKPGSPTSINIRNASTFAGASLVGVTRDPLFVIDGIIVTRQDFDNLDASLIDNLTFLKDAGAAIYGAAGAKGVVLVTTKRGKAGKTKISYSGYFGNSTPAVAPKVMSAYEHAKMLNNGYELNNAPLANRFSQEDLDFLATKPYKSWYDELWNSGNVTRHTINVSGGTEKVTFFAGGNYYQEDGNYGGINLKKYGIRSGMNAKVANGLTANISMGTDFSGDERRTLKGANEETDDLSLRALFLTPQWVPLTIKGLPVNWAGPNPPGAFNPVALENSGNYKFSNSQGLNVNASLEYKPNFIKGLTARVQYGSLNRNANAKEYFPAFTLYNFVRRGQNLQLYSETPTASPTSRVSNSDQLGQSTTTSNSYQLISTLSYGLKAGKHDFDIMAAFDQSESESQNVFFYKNEQTIAGIDQFWAFSNASSVIRNPAYTQGVKRSFLSRMNYSFDGKYLLEAITRYDASSNFAPDKRWGLFPSVGLGWIVSEENFFRNNIKFINMMKIRANLGVVGEDRVNARLWESRFTQTTGALIGTVPTNGLDPNIYPNPNISWEKARTINVGFDLTTLGNKLNITVDLWNRYTYDGFDRLDAAAVPATFGANAAVVNYGKQLSWGSEFSVGYRGRIKKDWTFNVDVNFGFTNSMLLQSYYNPSFLGTAGTNELGILVGRDPRKYNSSNYGYISKGILRTQSDVDALLAKNPNYRIGGAKPQVGFLDFEDVNGDGQINDNDITTMFERTTPVVTYGISLGVAYKSFKLSTNLNLALGGKYTYDTEARKVPTTTQNAPSFWVDHWTPENPNAKFPRADAPLARENSSFWVVSGVQSRINNMTLSYSIPSKVATKLRIPEMKAFFTGTNLWSISNPLKYKDQYTSNFANYPTLRTISLGINATL